MTITATPVSTPTTSTSTSSSKSTSNAAVAGIASNFNEFLTLLTTQLQNQNPLNPLDTNQFTQQLVQFAQVEQQLNANDSLTTLVSLQQANQSTQALAFVGQNVTLNGSTAALPSGGSAGWTLTSPSAANATVNITSSTGQTVFTGNYSINSGANNFSWNGQGNDGTQWPAGNYTMNVTAKDSNGNTVAVSTQIVGTVSSVDLTKSPPLLSVGGQSYTINQVQSVGTAASSSTGTGG
ncbi:MAG: flagellar hook assembly protein FlgD [Xanthobacteraceae bacterium]